MARGGEPIRREIVLRGLSEDARLVEADRFGAGLGAAALRADFFFLGGKGALRFPLFPDLRFAMPEPRKYEERVRRARKLEKRRVSGKLARQAPSRARRVRREGRGL